MSRVGARAPRSAAAAGRGARESSPQTAIRPPVAGPGTHERRGPDTGRSLPREIGGTFGRRLGHRFGEVRVHHDAESARLARAAGAAAVTVGRDIFFGAGHYQPSRPEGRRLIGHELVHVAQWQRGGRNRAAGPLPAGRRHRLEEEARTGSERVLAGEPAAVASSLDHASPLLHPVYISRHGTQGFLDNAFEFFSRWGYSPITRGVDSIQQIVADLSSRSAVGRVTIVSHAHPTNINMALVNGGSAHVLREHLAALTVPRTGVIAPGDTPPATVAVPGILPTATPTARTSENFEALVGREGDATHLLPATELTRLMTAIAGDQQASARLAKIGNANDSILRQYVWWTFDGLFLPHGGFAQDRAERLRQITERARESYRGTIQVAAAVAPAAITDRDFERLDQEIARLTAGWAWPVPGAGAEGDQAARDAAAAAEREAIEQRATTSPYAVINAILWNPDFLPELAGADRRVAEMAQALPRIESHYMNEATRDNVLQQLAAGVLAPLGGGADLVVQQWVWWVVDGAYPRIRGFSRATRNRIETAAAVRRRAYRDLIIEAIRAGGGQVPDQAVFDAAAAEVRQALAGLQFGPDVETAARQAEVAAQIEGSEQAVAGVVADPTFLNQLELVRALVTANTWFEIQGCRAGQDLAYLEAFRDFFANSRANPRVTAPDWFQYFGTYGYQPASDAQVRTRWRRQWVQDAFAYWHPLLTGEPAIAAPTHQDLLDFLMRPMALPLISPGNLGHNQLMLHESVTEDAFLGWLTRHGYRLTRQQEIQQALFQTGNFRTNVRSSFVDWLQEQRVGGEVRFRPDPDYANHIQSAS